MKKVSIILFAALLAAACAKDPFARKIHEGSALGYPVKQIDLEAEAGEKVVSVISNREYAILCDAGWLSVPASAPAGRDGFRLGYTANNALPRKAEVIVSIEETNHKDTLVVRQKSKESPRLSAATNVISLKGSAGGKMNLSLDTNIPDDEISLEYECEGGWISNIKLSGGTLTFDYDANPEEFVRRARASLSYTDIFDKEYRIDFQISQMSSADSSGDELTLPELVALATEEGYLIAKDIVTEGIVVSNKESGNCGEPRQTGLTSIDYDPAFSTIYLEAVDGSVGIMMKMESPKDNTFEQGDKVKWSLKGATLYKSKVVDAQTDPVYYYLTGVKGNMAIENEHLGREGIPVKEKYIGGLSDEDIFTYVTIKDCELPVRKGSLTPVSEKFTMAGGSDKVTKFAILLRDITGASMYLYTNMTCPYRRDGSLLPQGSGKMSGVVVHELYPRFNYLGSIGRYQLRHTSKEDFDMAEKMEDGSFSAIICEWRYITAKNLEQYPATDGDKSAYFTYSFVYPYSGGYLEDGRAGKLPIIKASDWSYIGPAGMNSTGHHAGLGVILSDGQDWMSPYWSGAGVEYAEKINANGYGEVPTDAGSAWSTNLTARNGDPQYTTFVFSTKGITSSKMSMQISSMNRFYSSTQNISGIPYYLEGPRYWWVEYSLDNSSWTKLAKYALPELCQETPVTQPWQTPGFMSVNVALPASILLDKETVYVRLIPDEGLQTGSQTEYLEPSIKYPNSGSFPTSWNYIGFRYNKVDAPATEFGGDGGSDIDPVNPVQYTW